MIKPQTSLFFSISSSPNKTVYLSNLWCLEGSNFYKHPTAIILPERHQTEFNSDRILLWMFHEENIRLLPVSFIRDVPLAVCYPTALLFSSACNFGVFAEGNILFVRHIITSLYSSPHSFVSHPLLTSPYYNFRHYFTLIEWITKINRKWPPLSFQTDSTISRQPCHFSLWY